MTVYRIISNPVLGVINAHIQWNDFYMERILSMEYAIRFKRKFKLQSFIYSTWLQIIQSCKFRAIARS